LTDAIIYRPLDGFGAGGARGWGLTMTTFQAIMFGVMLALTPSLAALAVFLYREWIISRNECAGRLELHD